MATLFPLVDTSQRVNHVATAVLYQKTLKRRNCLNQCVIGNIYDLSHNIIYDFKGNKITFVYFHWLVLLLQGKAPLCFDPVAGLTPHTTITDRVKITHGQVPSFYMGLNGWWTHPHSNQQGLLVHCSESTANAKPYSSAILYRTVYSNDTSNVTTSDMQQTYYMSALVI